MVGQIAIPLPPEMLRRSLAWQARHELQEEVRAEFDEARLHGLRARHATIGPTTVPQCRTGEEGHHVARAPRGLESQDVWIFGGHQ